MYQLLKKFCRFVKIYGLSRTFIKAAGRMRPDWPVYLVFRLIPFKSTGASIGIVGAGHHAFSSIAYFLSSYTKSKIIFSIDKNLSAAKSLAFFYGCKEYGRTYLSKEGKERPDIVYIASNHASHAKYAVDFLNFGCDVFVEKPIATTLHQIDEIDLALKRSKKKIYAGYNRPFAPAILEVKKNMNNNDPISCSFTVIGHFIPEEHWYRSKAEGSRVLANMGHWLDLALHLLVVKNGTPEYLDVSYVVSNSSRVSDDVNVTLVSPENDLLNIFFTSRSEPFEGVSENIIFQQKDYIAKIDDFRSMKVWSAVNYYEYKYKTKDNGHKNCVLQPFNCHGYRTWEELRTSAMLVLEIERMVILGIRQKRIGLK